MEDTRTNSDRHLGGVIAWQQATLDFLNAQLEARNQLVRETNQQDALHRHDESEMQSRSVDNTTYSGESLEAKEFNLNLTR